MGYEIKLIIGKSGHSSPELERDMAKPFEDGSGFEYKRNERGEVVKTGREETYFQAFAELDLCKLGYDANPLKQLIDDTHKLARTRAKSHRWYFYGSTEGNKEASEDRYGDPLMPVPVADVLAAIKATSKANGHYRRFDWAIALLESMAKDPEQLEVLFWGH